MPTPSVIDTNVIAKFQNQRLLGIENDIVITINKIISKGTIALDDTDLAIQEYIETCKPSAAGMNIMDWITDGIVHGYIKLFKMEKVCQKNLSQLGLPKKDCKWVYIAIGG